MTDPTGGFPFSVIPNGKVPACAHTRLFLAGALAFFLGGRPTLAQDLTAGAFRNATTRQATVERLEKTSARARAEAIPMARQRGWGHDDQWR
jgi:hypothetical protein